MCGIAGFYSRGGRMPPDSREILAKMGEALAHRGPDDHGLFLSDNCGLSFRRLSIIDLEHGHQPMASASEDKVIVFNGEIYNFRELRSELEGKGFEFRTGSDTEVLLAGYEAWGPAVLDKLRGIFAFAVYDKTANELFLARDHVGVKPLYFTELDGLFAFASEVKAFLQFPGFYASVRTSMIPSYMSFLWVPAPDTLFENVFMLEPGHYLKIDRAGVKKMKYWNPALSEAEEDREEETLIDYLDAEIRRIVEEQMISDVPLGAFLSGGVDSSFIVSCMNRVSSSPVITFTTGFAKEDLAEDVIHSDLEYARLASRHLNVEYNELLLSPDVVNLLPRLIWHMDEPVADPAAITTYLICKASKQKATVMLSGVGGDEVFGGYPRYIANLLAEEYRRLPKLLRKTFIESWVGLSSSGANSFLRNAKKFIKSADLPFLQRYLGYLTYYSPPELRELLLVDHSWEGVCRNHLRLYEENQSPDPVQSMMNLDLLTFLPNLNLLYTDKMSSAASVEVRVPYLDPALIETMARQSGSFKIRWGTRKYIFKKTAERRLPREVVWRRKAGFGAPVGAWIKGQAKEMMLDLLSEETVKKRGYFNYKFVYDMVDKHLRGKEYNANQIWQFMTLELWHRRFIDK